MTRTPLAARPAAPLLPAPRLQKATGLSLRAWRLQATSPAAADTVAWWHFDECEPGTTAPASTVASDQAPMTYAYVYTVGDSGAMSALHENEGDYLPTYTKPFRGLAVYDCHRHV